MNEPITTTAADVEPLIAAVEDFRREMKAQCQRPDLPPNEDEAERINGKLGAVGDALRRVWDSAYDDADALPVFKRVLISRLICSMLYWDARLFELLLLPCISAGCKEFVPCAHPKAHCPTCHRSLN